MLSSCLFDPPQKSSRKKDKEKQTCKGCNESFNFTKRKHHCKSCGAVSTGGDTGGSGNRGGVSFPLTYLCPAGHLCKVFKDLGQQDQPGLPGVLRSQSQPGEPGRERTEEESCARGNADQRENINSYQSEPEEAPVASPRKIVKCCFSNRSL